MSTDSYLTLRDFSMGEVREKASRFIGHAFPIKDEADFQRQQEEIARKHHGARHICHAWVLGTDGGRFRAFDAGEPSGSAGKPILRQLQGGKLTFSAIVVVRYFGGTLLGKAGLSHAFAAAAKAALANNIVEEHLVLHPLLVDCSYAQVDGLKQDVALCSGEVVGATYAQRCHLEVAVPRSNVERLIKRWRLQGIQVRQPDGR